MNASKSRCNGSSYPAQANRERKQCVGRDCISDISIISVNFTYSVRIISVETIEFSIRLAMTFTTSKSISNTLQLTNRRRLWLKTRFIDRYAEFWKNAGIAFFKNVQIIRRRLEKSSKEKPLNILQVLSRCFHRNAVMSERTKFADRCTFWCILRNGAGIAIGWSDAIPRLAGSGVPD